MVRITFHGAARTVTGSKFLLEAGRARGARRLRAVPGTQTAAAAELGTDALRHQDARRSRAHARPSGPHRLLAAHRPRRICRTGLRHRRDERARRADHARFGQVPGARRRLRQPQGLLEAQAGAAALRGPRRGTSRANASHGRARRMVFAGRTDLDALPRRRPSARLEHDRSRNPRPHAAAA